MICLIIVVYDKYDYLVFYMTTTYKTYDLYVDDNIYTNRSYI